MRECSGAPGGPKERTWESGLRTVGVGPEVTLPGAVTKVRSLELRVRVARGLSR